MEIQGRLQVRIRGKGPRRAAPVELKHDVYRACDAKQWRSEPTVIPPQSYDKKRDDQDTGRVFSQVPPIYTPLPSGSSQLQINKRDSHLLHLLVLPKIPRIIGRRIIRHGLPPHGNYVLEES